MFIFCLPPSEEGPCFSSLLPYSRFLGQCLAHCRHSNICLLNKGIHEYCDRKMKNKRRNEGREDCHDQKRQLAFKVWRNLFGEEEGNV